MRARLAVVGLGNPLAGDDGAGVAAVERLRERWGDASGLVLGLLEGDLYAVADLLDQAERIVFVDAVAGDCPGELVAGVRHPGRALAPSLHQADIGAVMRGLEQLGLVDPFPPWEVWGVTVIPPVELGRGLSGAVEAGVQRLVERLSNLIAELLGGEKPA